MDCWVAVNVFFLLLEFMACYPVVATSCLGERSCGQLSTPSDFSLTGVELATRRDMSCVPENVLRRAFEAHSHHRIPGFNQVRLRLTRRGNLATTNVAPPHIPPFCSTARIHVLYSTSENQLSVTGSYILARQNVQSGVQSPKSTRYGQMKMRTVGCVDPTHEYGESTKKLEEDSSLSSHQSNSYKVCAICKSAMFQLV
ncbi:hypothetical protein Purlil1_13635 [Purpureocillium lilacinum]|uniref:Secreted protein n=1 Tax=Purpureocillium lilacinum TaxID=33203 RepID=A0ABR0BDM7_PURLI|nr:hypothetical protein Purlil1_13635 [Purpureocillium lilacinum]